MTGSELARSKTLSWQQRPAGGIRGPRARPPAFLQPREPNKSTQDTLNTPTPAEEPSRADIAKSLSAKDPTWFRQTADRGASSAALRRNESESVEITPSSQKRQLPGLSNTVGTPERDESIVASSGTTSAQSSSLMGSVRGRPPTSEGDSSMLSDSAFDSFGNKLRPPTGGSARGHVRSESESTIGRRDGSSRERAGSPTKGMGGFVQSAMMRRSDSVSRRWNVPNSTGLSRQSSSAANHDRPTSRDNANNQAVGMPRLDDSAIFKRPQSRDQSSRPGSAHNSLAQAPREDPEPFSKTEARDQNDFGNVTNTPAQPDEESKPPDSDLQHSPSKRWSPSKSSWLESALSKPETPRAKPPPPSQPAWMADLQKNRQQRQSKDIDAEPSKDQGRSAPLWGAPLKSTAKPSVQSGPRRLEKPTEKHIEKTAQKPTENPIAKSVEQQVQKPLEPPADDEIKPLESTHADKIPSDAPAPKPKPTTLFNGPVLGAAGTRENQSTHPRTAERLDKAETTRSTSPNLSLQKSPSEPTPTPALTPDRGDESAIQYPSQFEAKLNQKPKPSVPAKQDFRGNLKPRTDSVNKPTTSKPEFLSAVGSLRRANTQKYVAPDVLGDNIRRGKSGLNITGGPAPRVRRNSFKESLNEQKAKIREKAGEGGGKPPVPEKRQASIPEALQKRQALGKGESSGNVMGRPVAEPDKVSAKREDPPKERAGSPTKRSTFETPPSPAKSNALEKSRGLSPPTVSSKLAGRFNPAIANVIARGPPSPSPERRGAEARRPSPSPVRQQPSQPSQHASDTSQPLEHMTKSRARGPKRRAPKGMSSNAEEKGMPSSDLPASPKPEASSPKLPLSPKPALGAKPAIRSSSRNVSVNVGENA